MVLEAPGDHPGLPKVVVKLRWCRSFDRRLLEMSKKTAEEEERYKKEMEKYTAALML